MKQLTDNEIKFVKETGFTPTVFQCEEYNKLNKAPYFIKNFDDAIRVAEENFNISLVEFLNKNLSEELDDSDSISLEYIAGYLLYTFFSLEELKTKSFEELLAWLQDYRYFFGFRKWDDVDTMHAVHDAIDLHEGFYVLYKDKLGNVMYKEKH